ncbi:MAG: hypothetical protein K6C97_03925 [Treponema sp.]|nr:hypothetical protein [Treponema sp.]
MDPPWGSKYTVNINTEMNYWRVNMTSLSECELPLFTLLERAYKRGLEVAQKILMSQKQGRLVLLQKAVKWTI